jgi:hypothetical protein
MTIGTHKKPKKLGRPDPDPESVRKFATNPETLPGKSWYWASEPTKKRKKRIMKTKPTIKVPKTAQKKTKSNGKQAKRRRSDDFI